MPSKTTVMKALCILALIGSSGFIWWVSFGWGGGLGWPFFAGYTAICSLFLIPLALAGFKRKGWLVFSIFILSVVILGAVPWTPREHFLQYFNRIKPGMTASQVDSLMEHHYLEKHIYKITKDYNKDYLPENVKNADQAASYRHSDDGAYNADIGEIYYRNGRVLNTRFLPD
ncbi:MAG: hypothetical protein NT018_11315 [Armatimonadetes bacterium]|nr:hypothetical protein [Armatimonadota bacterium]